MDRAEYAHASPGEVNELDGAMLYSRLTQEAISPEKLSQLTVGG